MGQWDDASGRAGHPCRHAGRPAGHPHARHPSGWHAAMTHRLRGFTLIELLVALFIAALMFAMGYGAINQALASRSSLQEQQARLLELQTAMRVLEQDFVQLAPRPVRAPVGYTWARTGRGATRGGWTNPNGLS